MPIPVAVEQQAASPLSERVMWDDLKVFLSVCEHKTVRRASAVLGLNPSTVSRRLRTLEETLSTQLFERHPTGLCLTQAGEEVEELCGRLDRGVRDLKRRVAGHDQRIEGTLRITAAEVVAQAVCGFLSGFQSKHPAVTLDLHLSDQMASLERYEADVAVRVAEHPPENLFGKKVGHAGVGLFASKSYVEKWGCDPLDPVHRFIEWPSALKHKPAFAWYAERARNRSISARIFSATGALTALRADLGMSVLGLAQAVNQPDLVLIERLPASCATPIWLLTHADLRKAARVRALMEHLGAEFGRSGPEIGP